MQLEGSCKKKIYNKESTEILSNPATIREVNSTEIVQRHKITCHSSAELQLAKLTLSSNLKNIEFTYGDFPCHLKVIREKLAMINHP